jgi:hypothetical protein
VTLELHIQPTPQSGYGKMLWSHPQITGDLDRQLEVQWLDGFLWVPRYDACMVCKEPTTWIDLAFEGPIHPGRCSERMQDDYAWANVMSTVRDWARRARQGDLPQDDPWLET